MNRFIKLLGLFAGLSIGCTEAGEYAHAVCALVDASGTYANERDKAVSLIKQAVLPQLRPGDRLAVIRIGDNSYQQQNIEARLTLDVRPSQSHAQKLDFMQALSKVSKAPATRFTDIRGAMLMCADEWAGVSAEKRVIVVFSDMKEELPKGVQRDFENHTLDKVQVVAMNVKRLKADSMQPKMYRKRLSHWDELVRSAGAQDFQVMADTTQFVSFMGSL